MQKISNTRLYTSLTGFAFENILEVFYKDNDRLQIRAKPCPFNYIILCFT